MTVLKGPFQGDIISPIERRGIDTVKANDQGFGGFSFVCYSCTEVAS